MEFTINDLTVILKPENKIEEKTIKHALTFTDKSKAFTGGRYNPMFEKKVCFLKDVKGFLVCFAGFAKEIILACKEYKIKITKYTDNRTHLPFQGKDYNHENLKQYFNPKFEYVEHQTRALEAMLKTNNGMIIATTSAGKGDIISAYMKITKMRILVVVDRGLLAAQLRERFVEEGIDCGLVGGTNNISGHCVVSTIQSVKKVNISSFECLIVDEMHKSSSKTFQDFFKSVSFPYKFGLSASPYNGDYYKYATIRQFLGSPICEIKAPELIEHGVITRPKITFIRNECEETLDYPYAYEKYIVKNERRNKKIIDIVDKYQNGIMILINHLEQGKWLEEMIPGAVYLKGEDSLKVRLETIKSFDKGEIPVLIGSNILNEGISINRVLCLVIAGGGQAITQTTQKIGRALRLHKEKHEALVYDFLDEGNKFLLKHSKARARIYKKEGFEIAGVIDEIE